MLLLAQNGQKLHVGLTAFAVAQHQFASDVVLELLIRIAGLKPAQFEFMLAVHVAESV